MALREYQQAAVNAVINWLRYKPGTPAIVSIPTGGGKSWCIAALAEHYFNIELKNVLILAHRKELLEQTGEKLNLPNGALHFYSASMGEKSLTDNGVTIAAIQSISRVKELPSYGIVICDEAQMLSNNEDDDSQYWSLIRRLGNPPLVGLTATPWRLRGGKIGWGEIVYEIGYNVLIEAGYLAPLSNKLLLDATPNLESVEIKLGEYVQSQLAVIMESPELLAASIRIILHYSQGRESCLIFTVSVNHAYLLLRGMLETNLFRGRVEMVTGETPQWERDMLLDAFRAGEIRYLINCELLLVGFDAPRIDAIFCFRPTKSKVLWEQMCGRAVRVYPTKINALLCDAAGNLSEHGGLGTPYKEKSKREAVQEFGKICPECEEYVSPPTARQCTDCGYEFPEPEPSKISHDTKPDMNTEPIYRPIVGPVTYEVSDVTYKAKTSKAGNEMVVVSYHCGYGKYGTIADFLLPFHKTDSVRAKVHGFYQKRGVQLCSPLTNYSMSDLLAEAETMKRPVLIKVDHTDEYPRIIEYIWERPVVDDSPPLSLEEYLEDGIPF